jgi:hypothetical protein
VDRNQTVRGSSIAGQVERPYQAPKGEAIADVPPGYELGELSASFDKAAAALQKRHSPPKDSAGKV